MTANTSPQTHLRTIETRDVADACAQLRRLLNDEQPSDVWILEVADQLERHARPTEYAAAAHRLQSLARRAAQTSQPNRWRHVDRAVRHLVRWQQGAPQRNAIRTSLTPHDQEDHR